MGKANKLQRLPCLKQLNLSDCPNIFDINLADFFCAKWLLLEKLEIMGCSLTEKHAEALCRANHNHLLPTLQELDLCGNPKLSGAGLRALLGHAWLVLIVLRFNYCSLNSQDLAILSNANRHQHLPRIQTLHMAYNPDLSGKLSVLLKSTWSTLEDLDVRSCSLTTNDNYSLSKALKQGRLPKLHALNGDHPINVLRPKKDLRFPRPECLDEPTTALGDLGTTVPIPNGGPGIPRPGLLGRIRTKIKLFLRSNPLKLCGRMCSEGAGCSGQPKTDLNENLGTTILRPNRGPRKPRPVCSGWRHPKLNDRNGIFDITVPRPKRGQRIPRLVLTSTNHCS